MLFKTPIAKSGFTAFAATSFIIGSQQSFAAEGGEPKGLPQLDISTWPNQLLWLAATFLVGYMLMAIVQISVAKLSNPNDFNIELNYVVIALFGYLVIGKSLFTRFDDRAYKLIVQFCVVVLAAISLIF